MRIRSGVAAGAVCLLAASVVAVPGPAAAATPSTWTWSTLDDSGNVTGTLKAAGRWPGLWLVCDANGDGVDAPAVWRAGRFEPSDGPAVSFGNPNFGAAVCGDWDGNGTDTPGLFSNGTWYLRNKPGSGPADLTFRYGFKGAAVAAGDWNGDGRDGVAVLTSNQWLQRNTLSGGTAQRTVAFGTCDAVYRTVRPCAPVVGDWDGDGDDDPGISHVEASAPFAGPPILERPGSDALTAAQNADFLIAGDWDGDHDDDLGTLTRPGSYRSSPTSWGSGTDKVVGAAPATPLACDANGDGKDVVAAYDAGVFVFGDGPPVRFGNAAMTGGVCGDWDGNGTDTPGLFVNGTWYLRNRSGSGPADLTVRYGSAGLTPIAMDWNHDGKDGLGVCTSSKVLARDSLTSGPAQRQLAGQCHWATTDGTSGPWLFFGDFNGNGVIGQARVDFSCWDYEHSLCDFSFTDEVGRSTTINGGTTWIQVGDWNGDHHDDLVWIIRNGTD